MRSLPNLAGRPFVNERPAKRLIGALWALAVVLLLTNGYRYWRYATTNVEGREQLQSIRAQTNDELARVDELRATLASFDLRSQNEEIEFLNRRIAERSFPWSELFEQLGEVLPRGVRVRSLAPELPEPQRRRRGRTPQETRVTLRIDGAAESGEALLDFVDSLFAHPAFEQPLLEREAREGGSNLISFNLETYYRPRLASEQLADASAPAGAAEAATSEAASGPDAAAAAGRPPVELGADDPSSPDRTPEPDVTAPSLAAARRDGSARRPAGGAPEAAGGREAVPSNGRASDAEPTRLSPTRPERSRPNASQAPGRGGGRR